MGDGFSPLVNSMMTGGVSNSVCSACVAMRTAELRSFVSRIQVANHFDSSVEYPLLPFLR